MFFIIFDLIERAKCAKQDKIMEQTEKLEKAERETALIRKERSPCHQTLEQYIAICNNLMSEEEKAVWSGFCQDIKREGYLNSISGDTNDT
jgi:hypothetical protein